MGGNDTSDPIRDWCLANASRFHGGEHIEAAIRAYEAHKASGEPQYKGGSISSHLDHLSSAVPNKRDWFARHKRVDQPNPDRDYDAINREAVEKRVVEELRSLSFDWGPELRLRTADLLEHQAREIERLRNNLKSISTLPPIVHGNHCQIIARGALKPPSSSEA